MSLLNLPLLEMQREMEEEAIVERENILEEITEPTDKDLEELEAEEDGQK
jgi:hypothetical protein